MFTKNDFTIDNLSPNKWYVSRGRSYLIKTGELLDWYDGILIRYPEFKERDKVVLFNSKKEAELYLDNYLKGQNMTLEEQLAACKESKALLEQHEKNLLERVDKQKVPLIRHGDYGYWHGSENDPIIFVEKGNEFRVVNNWCFCSFDICDEDKRKFVKKGNVFDNLKEN